MFYENNSIYWLIRAIFPHNSETSLPPHSNELDLAQCIRDGENDLLGD